MELRILDQANFGPAAARNLGAQQARGEFLAFTDDDCHPSPDWLRAFDTEVTRNPEAGVGGLVLNALPDNTYSSASQVLIDYLYGYFNSTPGLARLLTTNNFCISRSMFLKAGGFSRRFTLAGGEDREFCDRWLHLGNRLNYAPAAIVHHAHRLSLASFARQHFTYGCGARQFHKERRRYTNEPVRVEPFRFYRDLMLFAWRSNADKPVRVMALMALSQAATVLGFFREAVSPAEPRLRRQPQRNSSISEGLFWKA